MRTCSLHFADQYYSTILYPSESANLILLMISRDNSFNGLLLIVFLGFIQLYFQFPLCYFLYHTTCPGYISFPQYLVLTQFKIISFFSDPEPVAGQSHSPDETERIRVHTTPSRQTPADNRAVGRNHREENFHWVPLLASTAPPEWVLWWKSLNSGLFFNFPPFLNSNRGAKQDQTWILDSDHYYLLFIQTFAEEKLLPESVIFLNLNCLLTVGARRG